jgi:Ca-activated chloride channel family protein
MKRSQLILIIFGITGCIIAGGLWYAFRSKYSFAHPEAFWLLLLVPLLIAYDFFAVEKRFARVQLSAFSQFDRGSGLASEIMVSLPMLLRTSSIALLVLAIARPQSELSWQNVTTEGIDIVIAMDISASMLAKDFNPNRLESAKRVAVDFIKDRPNDRIGLVVYAGESFTQCPLTTDHKVLTNLFKEVNAGMVEGGTAIGMGLANAVNRLRESEAKSKVVILLTDGDNNAGSISPITAAEIAKSFGVRVYTIGVGSRGKALSPTGRYRDGRYKYDYVDVRIDEESLQEIAGLTDGKYFRATNAEALENIYKEIDLLEKTKVKVTEHSQKAEEFFWFAAIGAALVFAEFVIREWISQTLT